MQISNLQQKKYGECKHNLVKSSTTKICEHIPSGVSMSTILSSKDIKNKHDVYRGKDYMKKFCECLKNHARRIILKRRK